MPKVQELHKHRGCKEILVNLLAALIGNVLYLAAAIYTGRLCVFKPDTNSDKVVKGLSSSINNVKEEEPELVLESSVSCH